LQKRNEDNILKILTDFAKLHMQNPNRTTLTECESFAIASLFHLCYRDAVESGDDQRHPGSG
jgi:hypothetical protein